jgi:hypothetical protein
MGKLCCPADGVLLYVNKQASFCVAKDYCKSTGGPNIFLPERG